VPGKIRPLIVSLLCGSTLLLFWAYLDRAGKTQFAAPPAAEPTAAGQPAVRPAIPTGYYGAEGEVRDDGEEGRTPRPAQPSQPPSSSGTAPVAVPAPAPTTSAGNYRDGTYSASAGAPWGPMTIEVTVAGGKWTAIKNVAIPDSPPSYYAVTYLVQQALQAQNEKIDGVSGATYTSNAYRDYLQQIVALSKK